MFKYRQKKVRNGKFRQGEYVFESEDLKRYEGKTVTITDLTFDLQSSGLPTARCNGEDENWFDVIGKKVQRKVKPGKKKVSDGVFQYKNFHFEDTRLLKHEGKFAVITDFAIATENSKEATCHVHVGNEELDLIGGRIMPEQREKAQTLEKSEREMYERLRKWTGSSKPLRVLWFMIEAKQTPEGNWKVPSSSGQGFYVIPEDLSACDSRCTGYKFRRDCEHLKALNLRTHMEFKKDGFVVPGLEEDHDEFAGTY